MKKKLFIFSNESINSLDGKFYCDNIDLKTTPEGLNKKFDVNLFGRKSNLTLAATTFVASMILMIAHWNWMDPSIANLQPVLDSYWLMIHVAVIVGSYGPFALGMIIGVVSLLLIAISGKNNKEKIGTLCCWR